MFKFDITIKKTFYIFLLLYTGAVFGQTSNTQKLFYDLPIDKNKNEIISLLWADSVNFNVTKKTRNTGHCRATPKVNNPLFNPEPSHVLLSINVLQDNFDSIPIPAITLDINYSDEKTDSKKIGILYEQLVAFVKGDFGYIDMQRNNMTANLHGKNWPVYENVTHFYTKKGDKKAKLSITWVDMCKKNMDNSLFISYRLD